jgi:hypothetical protein
MKTNEQAKKLLITGIPGMGKTNFGNYLAAEHRYVHIDMESGNYISAIMVSPINFIENFVKEERVVVTWGFVPSDEQINTVKLFRNYGFKIIWFDGDRVAARREFTKRDQANGFEYLNKSLMALDLQLGRIENTKVIDKIEPIIINTFNKDHAFKHLDQIFNEIENV